MTSLLQRSWGQAVCQCATEKREESPEEEEMLFSLDLNTVTESLLTTVFGSKFQTAGAERDVPKGKGLIVDSGPGARGIA